MLLQFSVGNSLSFKNIVTLSMIAAKRTEHEATHVFSLNNMKLLKSAVIYGANASGKSNIFKSMSFMKKFILNSSKDSQAQEKINVRRFKLSTETEDLPSLFEIVFMMNGVTRYRYGFQVDQNRVHREWLFFVPVRKEILLFSRDEKGFTLGSQFKEGKDIIEKTRDNALFLSVVAQFNGSIATSILSWFKNFNVISGLSDNNYLDYTIDKLKKDDFKLTVLEFLKKADLGIEDVNVEESKISSENIPADLPDDLKALLKDGNIISKINVQSLHKKFDKDGQTVSKEKFNFGVEESEGTKKFFALSGPIIDTLRNGRVLMVDEFDSKLHPLLSQYIIDLFNSKETNSKNAQLIFASHDVNMLNRDRFRRDQIWFTDKDKEGSSQLYSLIEYKVRKDASFGKDYLMGKYGGTPIIKKTEPAI